jgi:hypothetical protein
MNLSAPPNLNRLLSRYLCFERKALRLSAILYRYTLTHNQKRFNDLVCLKNRYNSLAHLARSVYFKYAYDL